MQEIKRYTVDLTKTDGNGEFNCPKCGTEMSPDDETEAVYTVLDTVMKQDCLQKIILRCNKCGSQISLVGFDFLFRFPQGNCINALDAFQIARALLKRAFLMDFGNNFEVTISHILSFSPIHRKTTHSISLLSILALARSFVRYLPYSVLESPSE